ncbi:MAG: hypothetical protein ABI572_08790 [Actinomycetota bacterium]
MPVPPPAPVVAGGLVCDGAPVGLQLGNQGDCRGDGSGLYVADQLGAHVTGGTASITAGDREGAGV